MRGRQTRQGRFGAIDSAMVEPVAVVYRVQQQSAATAATLIALI
jgi:hypothetical protein